jgi:lysozyme
VINGASLNLIKRYESLQLKAYLCPAGVPTIGFGHTKDVSYDDVTSWRTCTVREAEAWLEQDCADVEMPIRSLCVVEPNDNQIGAMVCLAFNIGLTAFAKSTVLKRHNAGDFISAAAAFSLFNKATVDGKKVVMPGLVARRAAEAALYLRPMKGVAEPMPQAVEPERSLVKSSIMQGGSVAAVTSGLALTAELAKYIGDIRTSLGDSLPYVALGVVFCAACWTLYKRFQQRKEGKA